MKALQKTAISAAAVALLTGLTSVAAFAEEAAAPEVSPITANVTVTNDYRYRGITQSNYQPAVQGGFDYAHESGFYIGNWNSSINWIGNANPGVTAPIEMDFYGGFKKELIGEGFASDFGVLQYFYPAKGNYSANVNPNTTELYAAQNFTFGPVTGFAKVSYALTTLFGTTNSAGSTYPDLTVNYDTGFWGLTANGHIGYQYVAGQPNTSNMGQSQKNISYTDWKLGMTKDFGGGLSAQASYISTNANPTFYSTTTNGSSTWAGRGGANVSLTKVF
jgi:uncharacterized protein (TIGR02001 family)